MDEAVVKILLDTRKVDVNSKDSDCQTPLWWAALNGQDGVVKVRLGFVDSDREDSVSVLVTTWNKHSRIIIPDAGSKLDVLSWRLVGDGMSSRCLDRSSKARFSRLC